MDRSFLTEASVVAASRNFVCIRLATYEDEREAEYLKWIYTGRSGQLENTVFGLLTPDGQRKLSVAGRGPNHAFRNSSELSDAMNRVASRYPGARRAAWTDTQLPTMKRLDLALNVAAADGLPVVFTYTTSESEIKVMHQRLLPFAWRESLGGQFVYADVLDAKELKPVIGIRKGVDAKAGIYVVAPDPFGLTGKLLASFPPDVSSDELRLKLNEVVVEFPREEKSHQNHVRLGIQLGIDWESEIPETDPQSLQAKERARGGR